MRQVSDDSRRSAAATTASDFFAETLVKRVELDS